MANSKVRWNGTTEDERITSVQWGSNSFTWGDVSLAIEVAKIINTGRSASVRSTTYKHKKEHLKNLFIDEEKKRKFIHLICRIKGEKVYDDKVEVKDINVKVKDVELVVETIVKKVKLEIKENV